MFDNEPLTPSEAVTDTSPDLLDAACELWAWLRQLLLDDLFLPIYRSLETSLASLTSFLTRVWHNGFGGKPHARHRPRNTRVRLVQAKRKAMGLAPDGKCCGLRSRKASYAFRLAEQRFYDYYLTPGVIPPRARDFEHVPVRRRKREAQRPLRWKLGDQERAWMEMRHANACEICAAFALGAPLVGELSTEIVDNFDDLAYCDTQESEWRHG